MILLILLLLSTVEAKQFKYNNGMIVEASDYKAASKKCFNLLTQGKYPGEEKGLDIIDVCANPKK